MAASRFSEKVEGLIREQMATGHYSSEDELLVVALGSLSQREEDLQAIKAGLESIDRGEPGIELAEAFRKIRESMA